MVEGRSLVIVNLDESFDTEWRVYIDDKHCNDKRPIQHSIVDSSNISNMHFDNEEELLKTIFVLGKSLH